MKIANVMNTRRNIPNWDISAQDIIAHKQKMVRPVIEIIKLDVADVIVESPRDYETEKENL